MFRRGVVIDEEHDSCADCQGLRISGPRLVMCLEVGRCRNQAHLHNSDLAEFMTETCNSTPFPSTLLQPSSRSLPPNPINRSQLLWSSPLALAGVFGASVPVVILPTFSHFFFFFSSLIVILSTISPISIDCIINGTTHSCLNTASSRRSVHRAQ